MIKPGDCYAGKLNRYYRSFTNPQIDIWNPPDNPNGEVMGSYVICINSVIGNLFTYISYQRLADGNLEALLTQRGLHKVSTIGALREEVDIGGLVPYNTPSK